jgi:hypothetical protein
MDADDISFPNRFTLQVKFLQNNPVVDLVATKAVIFSIENDHPVLHGFLPYRQYHSNLVGQLWRNIPLPHPTWMGKAEWFRRNPYANPEVVRSEDQDLLLRASLNSTYYCLPEPLLAYYQSNENGFSFNKSWLARRSLWRSQVKFFLGQRRLLDLSKATANFALKILLDILIAVGVSRRGIHSLIEQVPTDKEMQALKSYCAQLLQKSRLV